MKNNYENLPYEFLLLINNKPIVGRNFSIRGFNNNSLRSLEIKYVIDDAVDIIKHQFKLKTSDYLFKYYNPYFVYSDSVDNVEPHKVDIYANEDIFTFQIKVKGNVIIEKIFTGNDYPPKVRYDVDIRKIIPRIIATIQNGLVQKNYTKELCGYAL
jgi:hypothetical protein